MRKIGFRLILSCIVVVFAILFLCYAVDGLRPYQEWGIRVNVTDVNFLPAYTTINNVDFDGHYPIVGCLEKKKAYWFFWHYECENKFLHRIEDKNRTVLWGAKEGYDLSPKYDWWVKKE